jgi:hypothetical protein
MIKIFILNLSLEFQIYGKNLNYFCAYLQIFSILVLYNTVFYLKKSGGSLKIVLFFVTLALMLGCSSKDTEAKKRIPQNDPLLTVKINPEDFKPEVDHPYFTLQVGTVWQYAQYPVQANHEKAKMEVLPEKKPILGVETTVVQVMEWRDDKLIEKTHDWYAQDLAGNVWYFGESVDVFRNDTLIGHHGAWMAGENGAMPGIIMPAIPAIGMQLQNEMAKGVAEDKSEIIALDATVELAIGKLTGCLKIREWNPLEPGKEEFNFYSMKYGNLVLETTRDADYPRFELVSFSK